MDDRIRPLLKRHQEKGLRQALGRFCVVALIGPRQCGKATLVRALADDLGMPYISMDAEGNLLRAQDDIEAFMLPLEHAVIDEVQRVPQIILAIKKSVDEDQRSGRFLITGSVDLFRAAISPDNLVGRMLKVELLPLSQAEIEQKESVFLRCAFIKSFPAHKDVGRTTELAHRMARGGYPEAVAASDDELYRHDWFLSYGDLLADRNIHGVQRIQDETKFAACLKHMALNAGQLLNLRTLSSDLGISRATAGRWVALLERWCANCLATVCNLNRCLQRHQRCILSIPDC